MQALQSSLEPGDIVSTTSGLRGTVVDASYEDTVDLEIADGVVTTWVRAAVREKIASEEPAHVGRAARRRRGTRRAVAGTKAPVENPEQPSLVKDVETDREQTRREGRLHERHPAQLIQPAAALPAVTPGRELSGNHPRAHPSLALPGGVRRDRRRALRAGVLHRRRQAHAEARHRPAGRHAGHADGPHGRRRRAAARPARAGPADHRAAGQRPGRERRRGRPRRQQHHHHGAGRRGRAGPVAGADRAAAVPAGDRPAGARRARPRRRPRAPPRHRAPHPTPAITPPSGAATTVACPAGRRRPGPTAGEACRVLGAAAGPEPHPGPAARPCPAARPDAGSGGRGGDARRPAARQGDRGRARPSSRAPTRPPSRSRCRRSTAASPIRSPATTTRRSRSSPATRTAPRSTCSARRSWRARRSRARRRPPNGQGVG